MTFVRTPRSSFEASDSNADGSVSLVCRHVTLDLFGVLRSASEPSARPRDRVVMLSGAGGAGKTTLLRLAAEHFRQQEGYTVIHLEDDITHPRSLLECALAEPHFAVEHSEFRTKIDAALQDPECSPDHLASLALSVLNWLRTNPCIAVLIDGYNEFYDCKHGDTQGVDLTLAPASIRYIDKMRRFSQTAVVTVKSGGVFIAAVSSSFMPLGTEAFVDALVGQLKWNVDVFSDEERSNWLKWHRDRGLLPADLEDNEICERAAYVPRMLSFFDRRHVFRRDYGQEYTKAIAIRSFEAFASDYYDQRVLSALRSQDRDGGADSRRDIREHHNLLLQLIRQDQFEPQDLPPRWRSSGMIISTRDSTAMQFACPSARDAVVRYCQWNLMNSIEILAADPVPR